MRLKNLSFLFFAGLFLIMLIGLSSALFDCDNLISEQYCSGTESASIIIPYTGQALTECESWCEIQAGIFGGLINGCCHYDIPLGGLCSYYNSDSLYSGGEPLSDYAASCNYLGDPSCLYGDECSLGLCIDGICHNSCADGGEVAGSAIYSGKGCSVDSNNPNYNSAGTCAYTDDSLINMTCDYNEEIASDSIPKIWVACENVSQGSACDSDAGGDYISNGVCVSGSWGSFLCASGVVCENSGGFLKSDCSSCSNGDSCDSDVSDGSYSPNGICNAGVCELCTSSETICNDGLDNDCDGTIDLTDSDCSTPTLHWATNDANEYEITTSQTSSKIPVSYKAIIQNAGAQGDLVIFYIKEQDSGLDSDDDIYTGISIVDADNKARFVFKIDSGNLSLGTQGSEESSINDEMEFYFETNITGTTNSPILNFTYILGYCDAINTCNDYLSSTECNTDACGVNESIADCDPLTDVCYCDWVGSCVGKIEPVPDINNNVCIWCIDNQGDEWCDMPDGTNDYCDSSSSCLGAGGTTITNSALCSVDFSIGSCTYTNDESIDPSGCEDDGYLTYSWAGSWTWNDIANSFASNPDGSDFLESPSGTWRYDPQKLSVSCDSDTGTNNILCPAQIQLPFLAKWSIIAAIVLIVVIYIILNRKKIRKKKK